MKQNITCTIEELLCSLREVYLSGGEKALWCDSNWHVYVSEEDELFLTSTCCITAPPAFDEETDEEIVPEFALENGMDGSLLPEIFQDVISSALKQKQDATKEDLLRALNYYLDNDTFIKL